MSQWIRVAQASEVPPGGSCEVVAGERVVALFHTAEGWYALDGICPHQGGPLGKGRLTDCLVTCPWHGWQFDVRSGQSQLSSGLRQPTLAVKIEGDGVYVDLGAAG